MEARNIEVEPWIIVLIPPPKPFSGRYKIGETYRFFYYSNMKNTGLFKLMVILRGCISGCPRGYPSGYRTIFYHDNG